MGDTGFFAVRRGEMCAAQTFQNLSLIHIITGPDVNHIKNVLRMKPGERVLISAKAGGDYLCVTKELAQDKILFGILEKSESEMELPARIHLFQGLPKGDKMELIIQKAVELGAFRIIPVETKRVVVKLCLLYTSRCV